MDENLVWHVDPIEIGAESPPKAHFFWRKGAVPVRAATFTLLELKAEIERREAGRQDVTEFRRAYERLAQPPRVRAR
jgi:hypothetical protein